MGLSVRGLVFVLALVWSLAEQLVPKLGTFTHLIWFLRATCCTASSGSLLLILRSTRIKVKDSSRRVCLLRRVMTDNVLRKVKRLKAKNVKSTARTTLDPVYIRSNKHNYTLASPSPHGKLFSTRVDDPPHDTILTTPSCVQRRESSKS